MADTTTSNYGWIKPEVSGSPNTWGTKLNNTFDSIDAKVKTLDVITASAKATPANDDVIGLYDNSASLVARKLTWAQMLTALRVNNANWSGADLAVENGGTGASTGDAALANLGANNASKLILGTLPSGRLSGDYAFANLTLSGILSASQANLGSAIGLTLYNGSNMNFRIYQETTGSQRLIMRKYGLTTGSGEGYISIAGNGADDIAFNGSKIWTDANTAAGDINGKLGYTAVGTTRQVIAGNGLTGGGNLAADRTLALGTPTTLTGSTGNTVSATSHAHDVDSVSVVAAGLAGSVYNGSSTTQTNYPIGTILAISVDGRLARNEATTVRIDPGSDWGFRNYSTGTVLTGTWRGHGATSGGEGLVRRTA